MSTLRGANPLGAYLLVILSLLFVTWRARLKDWRFAIFPVTAILALIFTFSRSAWIGCAVAALIIGATMLKTKRSKQTASIIAGGVLIFMLGLIFALRHNATFQNVVAHTQDHSKVATSSNEGHRSALRNGLSDIGRQPLGKGPGTAGPASAYNKNKVRIAENYYVQVGQETGWIGLGLFGTITVLLGKELWRRRADNLALGLFSALIGLTIVNMLSHAWADDTLAYVYWGLAGIALAAPVASVKVKAKHTHAK